MESLEFYGDYKQGNTLGKRDGLTGTRSHHALLESYELYRERYVYVILGDVDNFWTVNETYGDDVGDKILRTIGQTLMETFGDKHTFHYGSDEFVIVSVFESEAALCNLLNQLNDTLSKLQPTGVSMSFGYAYGMVEHPSELHEAIRTADRQMFDAKRRGKACAMGVHMKHVHHGHRHNDRSFKSYEIDLLTGLANMTHFRHETADMLKTYDNDDDPLAVVHFNIQNFKGYNEEFGFVAGDQLLVLIGAAIQRAFPLSLVARSDADQFVTATTKSKVIEGIKQVRRTFRAHVKDSSIWLKAGVYVVSDHNLDIGVICDRAKLACDTIKGRRDVYYRIYDEDLKHQIATHHYVLSHFDEALEKGYIKVYYQPIVHVATGEVCDEEALARWDDPERGLMGPMDFIPVLEEARLIHKLDLYIVKRSCENMRRRLKRGLVKDVPAVSINLSRLDFELCDIVQEIEKILAYYDVPRGYVSIEVTESALTGNQEFLRGEIDRFRADGFEVWMDDFGSGYSSLNLLKDYTFDLIKLDMGFLRRFDENESSRILLANVIHLIKEMGIKTLVEGVETEEQLRFLQSVSCGKAQGYYFGKPQSLQMIMRSMSLGTYLPIEPARERPFFSKLAHVNLMRPTPLPSPDGHYVTCDTAAAILLLKEGKWTILNATDAYRDYWLTLDGSTMEDCANQLNTLGSPEQTRIEGVLTTALVSEDWEGIVFHKSGRECTLRFKMIADEPQARATALLVIAT
ncbi:MAG: bifunctional diguanylate cyclase/phosphodiesterase [Coriobacteriales bacterium]|nr:bifunctional diguanylate cyclase/phosphodiesterase [Coriobacteriales bacterium]